jgi:nitroreductase
MKFFDVVEQRKSIRAFAPTPVESEKLNQILAATNRAPSAGNFQAFEIYIVDKPEHRAAVTASTFNQPFVAQAPLHLVFCTNASRCQYPGADVYSMQDTTVACTFASLAVTALGLASCWIAAFDPEKLATAIGAPAGIVPIAFLAIGYAAEDPDRTQRRELSDVVHHL